MTALFKVWLLITFLAVIRVGGYFLLNPKPSHAESDKGSSITILNFINQAAVNSAKQNFPSVHANLMLGMTIGEDTIKDNTKFYDMLIQIGLVHVVVVSGYNVTLVIGFVQKVFYERLKWQSKIGILLFLLIYTVICGLQPPVIRASLMGYISYLATTEGRVLDSLLLLYLVCLIMLIVYPLYLISLSFWLSTGSTLGLMFFGKSMKNVVESLITGEKFRNILPLEDLSNSLACQLMVWPIISLFFGRMNMLSPLYNMAILWLIPICTVLGFIFISITSLLPFSGPYLSWLVFPFYDVFVRAVEVFGAIDKSSLDLKINIWFFILYYLTLFGCILRYKVKLVKNQQGLPASGI